MRGAHAAVATCLLLGAAACGESASEEADVASAYNAVVDAVEDKDYDQACEGLTDKTRAALAKAATIEQTEGCGATLERLIAGVGVDKRALADAEPSDVRLGDTGTAVVNQVRMAQEGGEWRVEGDVDFVRPFLSGAPR